MSINEKITCLVELDRGELWVMRHVNGLVAELLADLVNAVESADHQHLEVQLRGNPHEELHQGARSKTIRVQHTED